MAKAHALGHCFAGINLNDLSYVSTHLGAIKNLCYDAILGQNFQKEHRSVIIKFSGVKLDLVVPNPIPVCALQQLHMGNHPSLQTSFPAANQSQLSRNVLARMVRPPYIKRLLTSWLKILSLVVVKDPLLRHKIRLCVDYSQTINQYTKFDGYLLLRIDDVVNPLANYKVFSTFDLKRAYHQVPIKESDLKYTGFEANGRLYHFRRIPFGVTDGVTVFQRAMDKMVEEDELNDTFPYLDNITVAEKNQEEHDTNVQRFLQMVQCRNVSLNQSKRVESVKSINILGYCEGSSTIKPDPERLRPLQEFHPPTNRISLR